MTSYIIDYVCQECGQTHRVVSELLLVGGPAEGGSLDDVYPAGGLPGALAALLGALVWCDQAGRWVELEDPAGVVLTPRPRPGHDDEER